MRKFLLTFLALLFWSGIVVSTNAQPARQQAREAEWKNYALPKTDFTRKSDSDRTVQLRVPADWQQQGTTLNFTGPHSASFRVIIQKIPEGYPLDEYFAATLRSVRDLSAGAESIVTRRTQLQDVDARELVLDGTNPEGELTRSVAWIAIVGPKAFGFNLQVALTHAAEIEPYFKAMMQSVSFVSNSLLLDDVRSLAKGSPANGPVDEVENIVESLGGTSSQREAAVAQLTTLFAANSEAALDLLLDRRPLIRAGAVHAAARSGNSSLMPLLWTLLDDPEPFITETAARAVAGSPGVVTKLLNSSMFGFQTEKVARVWQFMPKEKRNELLEIIFKRTAVPDDAPPPAKAPPSKPGVSVSVKELDALRPGASALTIESVAATNPRVQLGALTLLATIPPEEFNLPLARILASNYDPLISVALQVAMIRREPLPVPPLLKLVTSSNKQVRTFAAESLAVSATVADVPAVEALLSRNAAQKESDDLLKLVIKKINFRNSLALAKTEEEKNALINKTLTDPTLGDFAWRHNCEATVDGCAVAALPVGPKPNLSVKPLGENLFPQNLKTYTAIPNPRHAVQRFYETLHGLQLDSPQTQASLLLMLTNGRKLLAQTLNAPADADELIDYSGIDPDTGIALGTWTAANARDGIPSAARTAIVLRVKDRTRFERNLNNIHNVAGGVIKVPEIVGGASRAIAALPALIPFMAQAVLTQPETPAKPKHGFPLLHYSFITDTEWKGFKLRVLETREINSDSNMNISVTYIAYVGDTAILTPDLASLRDVLTNASDNSGRKLLADNVQFRETVESHGDVIYFSDLTAAFAEPTNVNPAKVNERGALNFSNSAWENSHHIVFAESDWSKALFPFHPKELTAPRELLPASTIGYFLTKIDAAALSGNSSWSSLLKSALDVAPLLWAVDFKQDVLPELGPECGVALMGLPAYTDLYSATWAVFCKLKSNKLPEALTAGKLLRGVGPTTAIAEVKFAGDSYFVSARNGFLVVSNSAKTLSAFDGKTSLAGTRDYARTIVKVPNGVIAVGGYNLEAAVAAVSNGATEGLRGQIATVLFSFANAFHSQNIYATATAGSIEAHSSVSMDREGRYAIADLSSVPENSRITYAILQPHGVPITDQQRLSSLVLKLRAKAPGPIDNIRDDIKSTAQTVEQKSPTELLVTVAARTTGSERAVQLPVKDPELAPYLKATPEFAADKQEVIDQARQIAGEDRDAWSVAKKLADWTNKNLEWKVVASASPVQTLATREADCSEFSALFVAMARSLGLPARMVSGLAYSGTSFGGHAWVEVWAGRWIELDPTWGTSFVDATHVRTATNALITSAALNLIDIEVLNARRTVAEFQKSPRALAERLARVIPAGEKSEIEAAIDLGVLVDEHIGPGGWAKLSETEQEQLWSAYRRVVSQVLSYGKDKFGTQRLRLVHIEEKGDSAEAICLTRPIERLFKLRFVHRNDAWYLIEVLQTDGALSSVAEMMKPAWLAIEKMRAGEKIPAIAMSDMTRLLFVLDKDPAKAERLADELLKANAKDTGLRFLKGLALLDQEKTDEAVKLLTALADEGFAPALYRLAGHFNDSDEGADAKKAIELYERYLSLEPYDARALQELAFDYDDAQQYEQAAAAYRKGIEIDPTNTDNYRHLIGLVVLRNVNGDAKALLSTGEKYQQPGDDLFGEIMDDFFIANETKAAEKFAAAEPVRMNTSALANQVLGEMFTAAGRYVAAERLLNRSTQLYAKSADLQSESADAYVALAALYRKQSRWLMALKAADQAIALDAESHDGHFQRACALARLRRYREALAALEKSIELFNYTSTRLSTEPDLKSLSTLPAFKKLLPPAKKTEP